MGLFIFKWRCPCGCRYKLDYYTERALDQRLAELVCTNCGRPFPDPKRRTSDTAAEVRP